MHCPRIGEKYFTVVYLDKSSNIIPVHPIPLSPPDLGKIQYPYQLHKVDKRMNFEETTKYSTIGKYQLKLVMKLKRLPIPIWKLPD